MSQAIADLAIRLLGALELIGCPRCGQVAYERAGGCRDCGYVL